MGSSPLVTADKSTGRVMVLASGVLSVPLVRVKGSWLKGTFSADDLKDNFRRVSGTEADILSQEASATLESNPNLPRNDDHDA